LRLADAGLSARDLAQTIDAFNDGIRIAEITIGNRRIDLSLTGPENMVTATQGINDLPVVTRDGRIVPVSSLAEVKVTAGPTQVWHLERTRYVQIRIRPSKLIPLETTINRLREEVVKPMRAEGLPEGVKIRLAGAADHLTKARNARELDMLVAVVIVFLVMAVILESFLYPLIIMLSVPLATAGGMLGLWILNTVVLPASDPQPLDMLTILGFIIIIGTVVNKAILLVTYTVQNVRAHGMTPEEAILDSTRTRIRPIFMSTLTTVFGMLALVVLPGAGSELYRGLGSVVIGGLSLSALLTLLIIPPLLSLLAWKLRTEGKQPEEAGDTAAQPAE
ncbi:MAG: efflux RND transporter permease subunit, partial [Alphaproteobacteria bacterium]